MFQQNHWLEREKCKILATKAVPFKKWVFHSSFFPVTMQNVSFQVSNWVMNYFTVRENQFHF